LGSKYNHPKKLKGMPTTVRGAKQLSKTENKEYHKADDKSKSNEFKQLRHPKLKVIEIIIIIIILYNANRDGGKSWGRYNWPGSPFISVYIIPVLLAWHALQFQLIFAGHTLYLLLVFSLFLVPISSPEPVENLHGNAKVGKYVHIIIKFMYMPVKQAHQRRVVY